MGIRRVELGFEGRFTQIPNEWVRDVRLSRRARGLLTELMSHRPGWHMTQAALVKAGPEGREAMRTAVAELVEHGYLERVQDRGSSGRFGEVEYVVTAPQESTDYGFLGSGAIREIPGESDGDRTAAPQETADGSPATRKSAPIRTPEEQEHYRVEGGEVFELDIPRGTSRAMPFPERFSLSKADWEWAARVVPSVHVWNVTNEFVAYWREGEGKGKKKKNWRLTWQVWLKREHERNVARGWKPADEDTRRVIRGGRVVS